MWPDIVNGSFEMLGGFAILHHCWTLYEDKMVRGASWFAVCFFTGWGYWNLFFYPHLDQWWSFTGGVFIVIANTIWVSMMWYYIRKDRSRNQLWKAQVAPPSSRRAMLAARVRAYQEINRRD